MYLDFSPGNKFVVSNERYCEALHVRKDSVRLFRLQE